jgi:hypothetical protein
MGNFNRLRHLHDDRTATARQKSPPSASGDFLKNLNNPKSKKTQSKSLHGTELCGTLRRRALQSGARLWGGFFGALGARIRVGLSLRLGGRPAACFERRLQLL